MAKTDKYCLRRTVGGLSGGTRIEVIDKDSQGATVRRFHGDPTPFRVTHDDIVKLRKGR